METAFLSSIASQSPPVGSWLYMLRCRGDRFYIGVCLNLADRWSAHCRGQGARFTRSFPPQALVAAWHLDGDLAIAQSIEWHLKRLSRRQKERLIQGPESLPEIMHSLAETAAVYPVDPRVLAKVKPSVSS